MNKIPRASMSITILTDEDYRLLVSTRGGTEAFGVFVALVLAGRERLQQGQATQIPDTESLRLDNSTSHVLALTHLAPVQLADALKAIASVAKKTGGEPWLYADKKGHLVIRSFFKFNAPEKRGGQRPGAGRPSKGGDAGNQNEFNLNTDGESNRIQNAPRPEIKLKSNAGPSVSVSIPVPVSISPLPPVRGGACDDETSEDEPEPEPEVRTLRDSELTDADFEDLPTYPPARRLAPEPPAPPKPPEPTKPIGKNSPADVDRAISEAERLWPLGSMRVWVRQWLHEHPASFVIQSMLQAHDRGITWPAAYVQKVLDNAGKSGGSGPAAAPSPAKPRKIFTAAAIEAEMRAEMEADDLAYAQSRRETTRV